jgi:hypothetical protein
MNILVWQFSFSGENRNEMKGKTSVECFGCSSLEGRDGIPKQAFLSLRLGCTGANRGKLTVDRSGVGHFLIFSSSQVLFVISDETRSKIFMHSLL